MGEGLHYLNSLAKWKGRGGFTLEPLRAVLEVLGNPQDQVKTIHIGGTNGKGSVSAFISSILGQAGFKVGLNISPHLVHLNERIVIDGYPVSDDFFEEYGTLVKEASAKLGTTLSFHEAITAIAFVGFRAIGVDYAVIEVGLGGRLDASNVIKRPEVSVIVSIGHDHEDILGIGEANIAREKAGIIKDQSPAVLGLMSHEAQAAINLASRETEAHLHQYGTSFRYERVKEGTGRFVDLESGTKFEYTIDLKGEHQLHNAALAIKTCRIVGLSDIDIKNGLALAFWPGRLETIEYRDKKLVLDCAHNKEGLESLIEFLKSKQYKDVTLCFGALNTKDWRLMLRSLVPFVSEWRIVEPLSDSAVLSELIAEELSCMGINSIQYKSDYSKLLNDFNSIDCNRLILLTGSIYFVGLFRSLLDIKERPIWIRKQKPHT